MTLNKNKFDYKSMNVAIAKILFNFLNDSTMEYSFNYSFPQIKFIDMLHYNFNYVNESNINTEDFNKLIHNYSYNSYEKPSANTGADDILSLDLQFTTKCLFII
jgi:hypothetical protein